MAEHHHHKHREHRRDSASIFKEKSLNRLAFQKTLEKFIKAFLIVVAVLMAIAVFVVYTIN